MAALGQLAEQDVVGQRLLDVLLDDAGQGPGAVELVEAVLGQPVGRLVAGLDGHVAVGQLGFQLQDELLHDLADDLLGQRLEGHHGVQAVAELRREDALDGLVALPVSPAAAEADGLALGVGGAGVGGHDQDHIAEVDLLAVAVGQLAVVHHLQQDVVDVLVRLLDLVEQDDGVRVLVDGVGQLTALVIADVARRGADQAADRVALHVLAHVEAQQLDAERGGQLTGRLGLAHAGRTAEQVAADRLVGIAQAGPGHLHGAGQLGDGLVLAEHGAFEVALQFLQGFGVGLGDRFRRDAGDLGDNGLDLLHADGLLALAFGQQHLAGARLVDDVDRLVRQLAVGDVLRRQVDGRLQGVVGVLQLVKFLVVDLESLEDFQGVFDRRLVHVDLLEATDQGAILLEVLTELLVGGRAHATQ